MKFTAGFAGKRRALPSPPVVSRFHEGYEGEGEERGRGRGEDEKNRREGRGINAGGARPGEGDHVRDGVLPLCAAGYIADPGSRGEGGQRIILRAWSVKSRGCFMVEPAVRACASTAIANCSVSPSLSPASSSLLMAAYPFEYIASGIRTIFEFPSTFPQICCNVSRAKRKVTVRDE